MVRTNSLGQSGNEARMDLPESQMDENRIDSLAKQLAVAPSRRGVLRLMAGGALGALVSGLGLGSSGTGHIFPRSVEAAKKGNNQNSKQQKKDEPKSHQDVNAASNNDGGGNGGGNGGGGGGNGGGGGGNGGGGGGNGGGGNIPDNNPAGGNGGGNDGGANN